MSWRYASLTGKYEYSYNSRVYVSMNIQGKIKWILWIVSIIWQHTYSNFGNTLYKSNLSYLQNLAIHAKKMPQQMIKKSFYNKSWSLVKPNSGFNFLCTISNSMWINSPEPFNKMSQIIIKYMWITDLTMCLHPGLASSSGANYNYSKEYMYLLSHQLLQVIKMWLF